MNPNPGRAITVQSYLGGAIPNRIDHDPGPGPIQLARQPHGPLLAAVRQIGPPSGRYNCHGLVFASRRTNIPPVGDESNGLIDRILREDQYTRVRSAADAREGDIVIWRHRKDVDHTGIVTHVQREPPRTIFVWSMWGALGEFVHPVNLSPYHDCAVEFWRLR